MNLFVSFEVVEILDVRIFSEGPQKTFLAIKKDTPIHMVDFWRALQSLYLATRQNQLLAST